MSLFKTFGTNKAKETDGVAIKFEANADGTVPTFTISRMAKSNKRYAKALETACRPHQRAMRTETLSNDVAAELFKNVFISSVLVSYENIQDAEGNLITTDEGISQLFDALPDLYAELEDAAKTVSLFREEELEANSGN